METLKQFVSLRAGSIQGQLDGTIPSTTAGQSEDADSLIDASDITLSDMGSINSAGQGPGGGFPGSRETQGEDLGNDEGASLGSDTSENEESASEAVTEQGMME